VDRHARDIVGQRNKAPTRTSTGSLGPAVAQSLYVRLRFPRYAIIAGPMIPLHGRGLIAAPVSFAGYLAGASTRIRVAVMVKVPPKTRLPPVSK
jgi:hypothetical protein